MGIIIGGNAFDATDFNPSGEAASPTVVTRGIVLWLDAGNNASYANTANYYDCGYGCQYYSSNPDCTNCNTRWKDMSGNGKDAALLGSTAISYNIGGGSMYFSGSPDYAGVIGSLGSFSTFTVEIWFKSDSVSNYRNPIDCNWLVFNGGASGYSNIGPRLEQNSSGTLGWVIGDASGNYTGIDVVSSGLNSSLTHCAVITKTGASSFSSYYNGTNVTNTTFSNWTGTMGSVNIGRGFSTSAERWFVGGVSIVRIYNVALSAAEILQNYNNGRSRFGI